MSGRGTASITRLSSPSWRCNNVIDHIRVQVRQDYEGLENELVPHWKADERVFFFLLLWLVCGPKVFFFFFLLSSFFLWLVRGPNIFFFGLSLDQGRRRRRRRRKERFGRAGVKPAMTSVGRRLKTRREDKRRTVQISSRGTPAQIRPSDPTDRFKTPL